MSDCLTPWILGCIVVIIALLFCAGSDYDDKGAYQ